MKQKNGQFSFFSSAASSFGGCLLKGNPQRKRPLSTKNPVHLVLKSRRAFGSQSLLDKNHVHRIDEIVRKQAKICGVKIYHFVNVGNHLHLVLRIQDRKLYFTFIRSISGLIARLVLKRERSPGADNERSLNREMPLESRGAPKIESISESFWLARPFTRIASWGRDYRGLSKYMDKNRSQAKSLDVGLTNTISNSVMGFDFQI